MSTGLDVFDTTLEKSNLILKEIERELGWENRRNQSYLALRTVLHALRDRLPINDAVKFSAQLPILLKGIYFDGWSPADVPIRMDKEEFEQYIAQTLLFDTKGGIETVIKIVFNSIFKDSNRAESDKIVSLLPDDVASLLR